MRERRKKLSGSATGTTWRAKAEGTEYLVRQCDGLRIVSGLHGLQIRPEGGKGRSYGRMKEPHIAVLTLT
jgi:hypothetical protein